MFVYVPFTILIKFFYPVCNIEYEFHFLLDVFFFYIIFLIFNFYSSNMIDDILI